MARPTKQQQITIKLRDLDIYKMSKSYPLNYLALHFNLSKSTLSRIINKQKKLIKKGD